jgi:hypothetical protein
MIGLVGLLAIICLGLALVWKAAIGWKRALAAAACRLAWMLPLIASLTPVSVTEKLPNFLSQQPIHVFLDDSNSMLKGGGRGRLLPEVQDSIDLIEQTCRAVGCSPKVQRLSALSPSVKQGYSPIAEFFEPWIARIGLEPWILISDGSDSNAPMRWSDQLSNRGALQEHKAEQGFIFGFGLPSVPGYWVEDVTTPQFAFEGLSSPIDFTVGRASGRNAESLQIQALLDGSAVAADVVQFAENSVKAEASIRVPTPVRGVHRLTVRVLPVRGERDVWDNEQATALEVLPNTIGVLHLLGAPSWDGRYLRRYLKGEPKFDLISFYILRDPWDSQHVNERELSLIPFPVERLFKEELSHFKLLVIQNFSMNQFMQPEYQSNLVKFVKDGGGLLFIGGPRALTQQDLARSAIAEILPFDFDGKFSSGSVNARMAIPGLLGANQTMTSTYNGNEKYQIQLADPTIDKRMLASVYDDWKTMMPTLGAVQGLRGLHQMKQFKLKSDEVTPLLLAQTDTMGKVPLAVASYPGKGRALWLFSDDLWRIANLGGEGESRFDYNQFWDYAMTWLLKGERFQPLYLRHFDVKVEEAAGHGRWTVKVNGPAAKFLAARAGKWNFTVCDQVMSLEKINLTVQGEQDLLASGDLSQGVKPRGICNLQVVGQHQAFGEIKAQSMVQYGFMLKDDEMSPSPRRLRDLASLTKAKYRTHEESGLKDLTDWLNRWTTREANILPDRFRTTLDYYWMQKFPWIWVILVMLPLEVFFRRKHLLI